MIPTTPQPASDPRPRTVLRRTLLAALGTALGGDLSATLCEAASGAILRRTLPLAVGATLILSACQSADEGAAATVPEGPYVVVLGNAQDGGFPQAGTKPGPAWEPERRRYAASLGIVDPETGERWLVEATPDFREQLHLLDAAAPVDQVPGLAGILLTHAHVGHYTGLIHLGREVMGTSGVPVFAMPRMREFLATNGPWEQLVGLGNIELRPLEDGVPLHLNRRITVTPFRVPHRDEYSETVGFRIKGPTRTVLFLPDIDKWERWEGEGTRIQDVVAGVDVAYLDGTFFADGEILGRSISEIPHPFMVETIERFRDSPASERSKIRFIHLNRTNPALLPDSDERRAIREAGFRVAEMREVVEL
jgi:pyrroloquinoline quinone biosynthesis protein B